MSPSPSHDHGHASVVATHLIQGSPGTGSAKWIFRPVCPGLKDWRGAVRRAGAARGPLPGADPFRGAATDFVHPVTTLLSGMNRFVGAQSTKSGRMVFLWLMRLLRVAAGPDVLRARRAASDAGGQFGIGSAARSFCPGYAMVSLRNGPVPARSRPGQRRLWHTAPIPRRRPTTLTCPIPWAPGRGHARYIRTRMNQARKRSGTQTNGRDWCDGKRLSG
jgi:hypothetical protein